MKDDELLDDEGTVYSFDNIRTTGHLTGHVAGLKAAVEWLQDRAADRFRAHKDQEARLLRDVAVEMDHALRPKMEANAQRHREEFPDIVGHRQVRNRKTEDEEEP